MAFGPGAYDALATYAREQAQAKGVMLLVIDGKDGMGFSVQADHATTVGIPETLERLAASIRTDLATMEAEAAAGMKWYNGISKEDRSYWMATARSAVPADAWAAYQEHARKRGQA